MADTFPKAGDESTRHRNGGGRREGRTGNRKGAAGEGGPARPQVKALKVMMVKVSFTPGRVCRRPVTKWPISSPSLR